MKKAIILLILSLVLLVGCGGIEKTFVGKVIEIKSISNGRNPNIGMAHVLLDNGEEVIITEGLKILKTSAEVWKFKDNFDGHQYYYIKYK